jgi:hypothetical protein
MSTMVSSARFYSWQRGYRVITIPLSWGTWLLSSSPGPLSRDGEPEQVYASNTCVV